MILSSFSLKWAQSAPSEDSKTGLCIQEADAEMMWSTVLIGWNRRIFTCTVWIVFWAWPQRHSKELCLTSYLPRLLTPSSKQWFPGETPTFQKHGLYFLFRRGDTEIHISVTVSRFFSMLCSSGLPFHYLWFSSALTDQKHVRGSFVFFLQAR